MTALVSEATVYDLAREGIGRSLYAWRSRAALRRTLEEIDDVLLAALHRRTRAYGRSMTDPNVLLHEAAGAELWRRQVTT